MTKGDIHDFLRALFEREAGGKDISVVNYAGYLGKYQFGESALIDLGYYTSDGSKGNDWRGTWTGKGGITSTDAFLNSGSAQDQVAKEWIALLCKRLRQFGLEKYVGERIKGVEITDSGIIAGAHLKGFGTRRRPGVRAFLESKGAIDPSDGLGTSVSEYVNKFSHYDVGCCKSVSMAFVEKMTTKPIAGLNVQVSRNGKILKQTKTGRDGIVERIAGFFPGDHVEIAVRRLAGGYKPLKTAVIQDLDLTFAFLSPKVKATVITMPHKGNAEPLPARPAPKPASGQAKPSGIDEIEALWQRLAAEDARIESGAADSSKGTEANVALARNTKGHPVARLTQPEKIKILDVISPRDTIVTGLLFPLPKKPDVSYKTGARRFGSRRSNGNRKHAGIDLYASVGTDVLAVADGIVIQTYFFYGGTHAIEINHGSYIVRYGEVDSRSLHVTRGDRVKRGQNIGQVGRLIGLKESMLHLEIYSSVEDPTLPGKQLTRRDRPPYFRRSDLIDPTGSIDAASLD